MAEIVSGAVIVTNTILGSLGRNLFGGNRRRGRRRRRNAEIRRRRAIAQRNVVLQRAFAARQAAIAQSPPVAGFAGPISGLRFLPGAPSLPPIDRDIFLPGRIFGGLERAIPAILKKALPKVKPKPPPPKPVPKQPEKIPKPLRRGFPANDPRVPKKVPPRPRRADPPAKKPEPRVNPPIIPLPGRPDFDPFRVDPGLLPEKIEGFPTPEPSRAPLPPQPAVPQPPGREIPPSPQELGRETVVGPGPVVDPPRPITQIPAPTPAPVSPLPFIAPLLPLPLIPRLLGQPSRSIQPSPNVPTAPFPRGQTNLRPGQPVPRQKTQKRKKCDKPGRRNRKTCKEGFFEELTNGTDFTNWRTVDCKTRKTIKENEPGQKKRARSKPKLRSVRKKLPRIPRGVLTPGVF